jgi:hypothetical protein
MAARAVVPAPEPMIASLRGCRTPTAYAETER